MFTLAGILCLAMNGGPGVPHGMAFSFQIATDDQAETDSAAAKCAFIAMMDVAKIDIARIEAARRG